MDSANNRCIDPLIKSAQRSNDAFQQLVKTLSAACGAKYLRPSRKISTTLRIWPQETWIKVYQAIGKLKPPYHLEGWIAKIARNTAKDWLKCQQRKISRLTDELKSRHSEASATQTTLQHGLIEESSVRYRYAFADVPPSCPRILHAWVFSVRDRPAAPYSGEHCIQSSKRGKETTRQSVLKPE